MRKSDPSRVPPLIGRIAPAKTSLSTWLSKARLPSPRRSLASLPSLGPWRAGLTSPSSAITTFTLNVKRYGLVIFTVYDGQPHPTQLASLSLPRTLASLSKIPPFTPTGVSLSHVHKTGLGSSAALITSLVSALLVHFSSIEKSALARGSEAQSEGRLLAHNLSQYVHCLAQGKVGSGFDVAAAVFGSHLYTRFGPAVLQGLMGDDDVVSLGGWCCSFFLFVFSSYPAWQLRSRPLYPILASSNKKWDYRVEPFKLPPLTRMMLADVDAGSDTPSLVGKVLKWRSEKPEEGN